jgi:intein/homing endonuclease
MSDGNKKKGSTDKKFDPNKIIDSLIDAQNKRMAGASGRPRIAADPGFSFTLPMPYQPEFASPERVQWPIDRLQQNRYWRLFYKTDPVISTCVDMFSEIIGTEFTMSGEGVEKEVKNTYEYMIEKTQIMALFPYFIREFLVMGEVIPHLVFDKKKGIWTSLIFHNPDQIKVISSPFIGLDPILEYTPDETLRAMARSTNPMIQEYMNKLPAEVSDAILSGSNLPLNTSLNVSFLARKTHPYDTRGTSIFTRLYRILMYEDAVANASIATARRHAGPLKIAKLGDKQLEWVPEASYQDKIIQLLTVAEQDPHSFLILPWFVNFEAFGTTDKMMNIGREWDVIERIKLTALGVSQGFLHGECFAKGTKILMADYLNKSIQNVKEGDYVLDRNGASQKVLKSWKSETPERLVKIDLWGGKSLLVTENHKFPVWAWQRTCGCGCDKKMAPDQMFAQGHFLKVTKGNTLKKPEFISIQAAEEGNNKRKIILKTYNPYQKLEAKDICRRDFLLVPRKFDEIVPKVSLDYARLLGFYVAEGCYIDPNKASKYNSIQWTFNKKEKNTYAEEVMTAARNLGMKFYLTIDDLNNTCQVNAVRKGYQLFYEWLLSNGGRYSHEKQFSSEVMRWPLIYKEELIRALFKGDGCRSTSLRLDKQNNKIYPDFVVQYGTVSEVLADQIGTLLAHLGIYASLYFTPLEKLGKAHKHDVYNISCYGTQARKVAKLVWGDDVKPAKNSRNKYWVDENYIYVPVRKVSIIPNVERIPVYNLTVDEDHSYIAEGVATYNSTYASMKGNMQTLLMRLAGLRSMFESAWWKPKFFRPIAEMNEFVKPTKAEVSHKLKFRRSKRELIEDDRYIIPTLQWKRSLDPRIDAELLDAYEQVIGRLKFPISKTTVYSAAGLDIEEEQRNMANEKKNEVELAKEMGVTTETLTGEEPAAAGGGAGMPAGGEAGGEEVPLTPVEEAASKRSKTAELDIGMEDDEYNSLIDLIHGKKASAFWKPILKKNEKVEDFSKRFDWDRVEEFLDGNDFTPAQVQALRQKLLDENLVTSTRDEIINSMVASLDPDSSDEELNRISDIVIQSNKRIKQKSASNDLFFAGEGNKHHLNGNEKKGG